MQEHRDLAHLRVHAARRDDAARASAHAEGAQMRRIRARGERGARDDAIPLSDRLALPGEHGFVAAEVLGVQHAAIGGDPVPLLQFDDVPHDKRLRVRPDDPPVPHDFRLARREFFQLGDGGIGAVLLEKADDRIEQDDRKQNDGVGELRFIPRRDGKSRRERRGNDENDGHEIGELCEKEKQLALFFALRKGIRAVLSQPARRLRRGQTTLAACKALQDLPLCLCILFHTDMV